MNIRNNESFALKYCDILPCLEACVVLYTVGGHGKVNVFSFTVLLISRLSALLDSLCRIRYFVFPEQLSDLLGHPMILARQVPTDTMI